MIFLEHIEELVRVKGETLFHREGQELEFKEQFSRSGLADYFRDFAAFANNKGGHLIFGVKDSPRTLIGLSAKSISQFDSLDPEKITGFLLETYSSEIHWESALFQIRDAIIGVFKVYPAIVKPVIAKKDEGKDLTIKSGEIYYRYAGRTQKIQSAELENIINKRIESNNKSWLDLMSKIGKAGPQNAAILDTERALIQKGDSNILVLDDELAKKLKFIKEGHFVENDGAIALKLVGDVVPIDKVEVVRRVKENHLREYPLTATELVSEVKATMPSASANSIWKVISENGLKHNSDYSTFVFSNVKQEDAYINNGTLPKTILSLYKLSTVQFILKILRSK